MNIRPVLGMLLLAGLAHVASAQTLMVSNLTHSVVGSTTVSSGQWWANSFTTDSSAAAFTLNSVTLKINAVDDPSGNFFVAIYSNSGATPSSTPIGSFLTGAGNPTGGNTDNTYLATDVTLTGNTTYWVVAGVSSGAGAYEWAFGNGTPTTGTWTINTSDARTNNGGTSWAGPFTGPELFSLTATPIPEPATDAALLGLGVMGFAWAVRRRRAA